MPISPSFAAPRAGRKGAVGLRADLLPPTVPEVRRLLWHLVWARAPDPEAAVPLVPTTPAVRPPMPLEPTNTP